MSELKLEYKGEEIQFTEYNEQWRWADYQNASLAKVKAYIDRAQKTEFVHTPALCERWRDGFLPATVTSRTEDGAFWIKWTGSGKREKVKADSVIADTPENRGKLADMEALEKQITNIEDQIRAVRKSMAKVKLTQKGESE